MVLERAGTPLRAASLQVPEPGSGEILIKVAACGVCRTDLHVIDGELPQPKLPLVPGHEIVGSVAAQGPGVDAAPPSATASACPGSGWTCGTCCYCRSGQENLCDHAALHRLPDRRRLRRATRWPTPRFCFHAARVTATCDAAPLLCAGLIGYRALRMAGEARSARHLRLRRGGAHHRAGRARTGPRGLRVHPAGRRRGAGLRPQLGAAGPAVRTSAARPLDAAHDLRAGRRAGSRGAARRRRAARGVRRHPHERHTVFPYASCGGSAYALGRQPDAARRARSSCAGARSRSGTEHESLARRGQRGARGIATGR